MNLVHGSHSEDLNNFAVNFRTFERPLLFSEINDNLVLFCMIDNK